MVDTRRSPNVVSVGDIEGRWRVSQVSPTVEYVLVGACQKCGDTGKIPDPDRGSGNGPYFDTPCDCPAALTLLPAGTAPRPTTRHEREAARRRQWGPRY